MGLFKWIRNKNVKRFNFVDLKISAWYGIAIGFILATWIHVNIWIWVGLAILFCAWIIYRMFRK